MQLPLIKTERIALRLPSTADIHAILTYQKENEAHFAPFSPESPKGLLTEAFWIQRIAKYHDAFLNDQAVKFFIFDSKDQKEVVGALEFSQIARGPFQACYLGYAISKKHEGSGRMFEAAQAAIQYAFAELNLHRIMANHLPENERSARLLMRLGFTREGVAKEYLRIGGVWRDHALNSLRNPDWQERPSR